MKRNLTILGWLALAAGATAATWTVDSNTGRPADFRSLQAAHDSVTVNTGDVLHVVASTISYGDITLTKALTIIGPGYLLNQNLSYSVAAPSARAGYVTFNAGSEGSLVTGMEIVNNVVFGVTSNITVKRNYIQGQIRYTAGANSSNLGIFQNYVVGILDLGGGSGPTHSGVTVRGNYFGGGISIGDASDVADVRFNVIPTGVNMYLGGSCYAANNLIGGQLTTAGSALASNNWANSIAGGNQTTNLWTGLITFVNQFVGTGSLDARWQLKSDAAVKGTGIGGVDPGMFAGPDPYVLSGLPAAPMVIGIQAPSAASAASGLPVTVTLQINP